MTRSGQGKGKVDVGRRWEAERGGGGGRVRNLTV